MLVVIVLTRHAIERLFERFQDKKFDVKVVVNTLENVIKEGLILKRGKDIWIVTARYTLCCVMENDRLIVKTIMRTTKSNYVKAVKYGVKHNWNIIFENLKQVERWCKQLESMKNICKICGISKEQTQIERCKIYGFYICSFCCIVVGGFSEKCKGCPFYPKMKKLEDKPIYIY
ncbi:MAG TPA: hypothetical protein EYH04_05625 [Archaeoglobus profundus]|nr:hypothetical protein [Archaeoglobus profundus]